MLIYIARRLLVAIPTILLIVVLSFLIITAAPGGPFQTEEGVIIDPEIIANLRAAYHLDQPISTQLYLYMQGLLTGDLGPSFMFRGRSVSEIIARGFPVSLQLGLSAVAVGLVIGVLVGVYAAARKNSVADYAVMSLSMTGIAVPTFVTAPFLALVFGLYFRLLPVAGWGDGALRNMILPVTALALPKIGVIARITRGSFLEVMRANYIRTARSKGLPERKVIWRHTLRAAAIPIISYLGPAIATVMTGSVIIEQIFGLPGIGRSFVEGALNRDYPVVMGITILYASVIIVLNLITDLAYHALDPSIRRE
jgi:oligopeptide transport system permease protein